MHLTAPSSSYCGSSYCQPFRPLNNSNMSSRRLNPFKLERFFAKYEFQSPHLMCCSDCEPLKMSELLSLADSDSLQRWESLKLSYTESQGLPALREAISQLYSTIKPEQLMCCVPEEGVFLAMSCLLQPGDQVLATYPAYQSLTEIGASIGCTITHWEPKAVPVAAGDGVAGNSRLVFDLADVRERLKTGTKLVVVNFPHNPTGATVSPEDWQALIQMCRDAGAWLFSDEMYKFLETPPSLPLPSAADCYERAVTLCGLSKSWGLPGLRLGWLACQDSDLLQQLLAMKDYTTICNSGPSEVLALAAVRATSCLTRRCRDLIAANTQLANEFFTRWSHVFDWSPPGGGPIAFPSLRTGDIAAFCEQLVAESGVLLLPATVYDHAESSARGHFRVGLGRADFGECLKHLEAWLVKRYGPKA